MFQGTFDHFLGFGSIFVFLEVSRFFFLVILEVSGYFWSFERFRGILVILLISRYFCHFSGSRVFFFLILKDLRAFFSFVVILAISGGILIILDYFLGILVILWFHGIFSNSSGFRGILVIIQFREHLGHFTS